MLRIHYEITRSVTHDNINEYGLLIKLYMSQKRIYVEGNFYYQQGKQRSAVYRHLSN